VHSVMAVLCAVSDARTSSTYGPLTGAGLRWRGSGPHGGGHPPRTGLRPPEMGPRGAGALLLGERFGMRCAPGRIASPHAGAWSPMIASHLDSQRRDAPRNPGLARHWESH
jgi:hypothetical protein